MTFDESDVQRFMRHVDKLPSGCWFWTGARSRGQGNRKWYGTFKVKGRAVRAHRFACDAIGGNTLPSGGHRDHTCAFSMCVNPAHIECVTRQENQSRKMQRAAAC